MKNGFLTFCFAFVPGAGQMYQGYMKRGLSVVSLFCLAFVLGWLAEPLLVVMPVIWMYSFFDTFNLRAQIGAGNAPADELLIKLGPDESLRRLLEKRHNLVGWGLVVFGGYLIYEEFIMEPLAQLIWRSERPSVVLQVIYGVLRELPQLALCVALILLGLWLVRGPRISRKPELQEPEDFCNYIAEGEEDHDHRNPEE